MSGSPFVYYGDEIGLSGSGRDENKRAPMIWDSEGTGLTYGPPDMERQENRFADVQTQLADENSILNYYKRALRIRKPLHCKRYDRSADSAGTGYCGGAPHI